MTILSIQPLQIGVVPIANPNNSLPAAAQTPSILLIATNDTNATVTTAGYLNALQQSTTDQLNFSNTQVCLVYTTDGGGAVGGCNWYQISVNAATGVITLVTADNNFVGNLNVTGSITAGTTITAGTGITSTAGNIVATAGNISTTAGSITSHTTLTAGTGITSTTGNITATAGNVVAGSAVPAQGTVTSFPAASGGANDKLVLAAVTTGGNFTTTISNGAMGQSSVITTPDPGAATANFLLDAGAGNQYTDASHLLPIQSMMLAAAGGAWTLTRSAQGDWGQVHSIAADISILGFDITDLLRAAASRGFELTSFDVSYTIGVLALVAHSITLNQIVYTNNVANAVTQPAITSTLATATQAQPYLTNSTVNAAAFLNPAAGTAVKYVLELTVNAAATSTYSLQGINLRFTRTVK